MSSVNRICGTLKVILSVARWALPFFVVMYWSFFEFFVDLGFSRYTLFYQKLTITPLSKSLALAASILPVSIFIFVINTLLKLFENYGKGNIFVLENTYLYKRLGVSLIVLAFGNAVYSMMLSTAVSFQSERPFLQIDFSSNEFIYILIGALIYIISYVMMKGYKLENVLERTI